MNEQIRLLQAEIRADLQLIGEAFEKLQSTQTLQAPDGIVEGYYLNLIYGLFENMFVRIANAFGNHVQDRAQWHAQLLRRMTLHIEDVRPAVISAEFFQPLDELRRFRHVFRNAYYLEFDRARMDIVVQHATTIERTYRAEIEAFVAELDAFIA